MDGRNTQQIDTIVIGAGQAGLSAGYHLAKRGVPFAHPRCRRAHRRPLAEALGLASAVQPCLVRLATGDALSVVGVSLPDRARDGRLPRGVCRPLPPPRHQRNARRCGATGGRAGWRLRRDVRRATLRGDAGHRCDGRVQPAARPRFRDRPRSIDRPAAFERIPEPGPAARRRGPGRRGQSFGRGHRVRGRAGRIAPCSPVMLTASFRSGSSTRGARGSSGR